MNIIEIWTLAKSMEVSFLTGSIVVRFETKPCAQHCLSWFKANPAFVVTPTCRGWSC